MRRSHWDAAVKTALNARDLLAESHLLAESGRWARSYTLAHLAVEELAKAQMIRSLSDDADLEQAMKRMRDHLAKLEAVGLVVTMGDEESPEAKAIIEGARDTKKLFNEIKNKSL